MNDESLNLLKELKKTKKSKSNKFNILKNINGFDFDYIYNLILKEDTVIINDIILEDDTISTIKRKIYCNVEDNNLLLKHQYLWCTKK